MVSKVEEVARALCKADGKDPDANCTIGTCGGDVAMKEWQYHYPFMAMRAIEAMREPTYTMLAACSTVMPLGLAYEAMIDAALNEKAPAG